MVGPVSEREGTNYEKDCCLTTHNTYQRRPDRQTERERGKKLRGKEREGPTKQINTHTSDIHSSFKQYPSRKPYRTSNDTTTNMKS